MALCVICQAAPGDPLEVYSRLRDNDRRKREDRMFLTHTVHGVPEQYRLNVLAVQRASLHALQLHIANLVASIHEPNQGGGGCKDWKDLAEYLHKYCSAFRDLDYLLARGESHDQADSFSISSTRQIERDILEHAGLLPQQKSRSGRTLPPASDARKPRLGWRPPSYAPSPPPPSTIRAPALAPKDFALEPPNQLKRFIVAIAGAVALLIPVYIMVLVPGKAVDLVTASVAIMVVAIIMGLSPFELRNVLSITFGYAAVLIVFVGTQKIPYNKILE